MAKKSTAKKKTASKAKTTKQVTKVAKKDVIKKHSVHAKDTGSSQVQIALLTEQINSLSAHLESHPKDNHSRRGLIGLVGKRRQHLQYLKMKRPDEYEKVRDSLKLRK